MTPPVAVIEPEIVVLPELGAEAVNGLIPGLNSANGTNGTVHALPPGTRIEILTASTPAQAAAVVAAVEHFLVDTTPAPSPNGNGHQLSGWHRAAINEAITVRQRHNAAHSRL